MDSSWLKCPRVLEEVMKNINARSGFIIGRIEIVKVCERVLERVKRSGLATRYNIWNQD